MPRLPPLPLLLLPLGLLGAGCVAQPVPLPGVEVGRFTLQGTVVDADTVCGERLPSGGYAVRPAAAGTDAGAGPDAGAEADGGLEVEADFPPALPPVEVTLTHAPATGAAWVLLRGEVRDGGFDGQVLVSTDEAPRSFPSACGGCPADGGVRVRETLALAVLSASQAQAAGGACPAAPLDGGVPRPDDAGVRPPGPRADAGYDAVLGCGELVVDVLPAEGCDCRACRVVYRMSGGR
jgi:hypothetical protein